MGIRRIFKRCPKCESIVEVTVGGCESCGDLLKSESRDNLRDVMGFRPHYNASLGRYVNSQSEMHRIARQVGVERNGSPIVMRKS